MPESLQLRTEHSRSLEDADKFRALQTLTELGALIPLENIEAYHGRVAVPQETAPWTVDPTFANGGNDSGNGNVNSRPTLYTGERQLAQDFADARRREMDNIRSYKQKQAGLDDITDPSQILRSEVHRIASADTDARILDLTFDPTTLADEDKAKYFGALRKLVIPITEGSPLDFDAKEQVKPIIAQIKARQKSIIAEEDIKAIAAAANADVVTVEQMVGAYNAMNIGVLSPGYMADKLVTAKGAIVTDTIRTTSGSVEAPINMEYIERYMSSAHIVGVKQSITSATLGFRKIASISMFDLEKVDTPAELERQRQIAWRHLGALTNVHEVRAEGIRGVPNEPLMKTLEDVHAKPERLVADARKVPGYDKLFDADAGNWEGYTLGEHTETVLRNLDENYADRMPVQLLKFMRLGVLAHDLGKPIAAANGDRANQKKYNLEQAVDFFGKLGIDANTQGLLLAVIGEGQEYAFQIDVRKGGAAARAGMKQFAEKTLQRFTGSGEVSDDQTDAFMTMCRVLQICDGGAYTSMAVTRKASGAGRHRNAPSFNSTFIPPIGLGKRTIKLRKTDENSAPSSLAPRRS